MANSQNWTNLARKIWQALLWAMLGFFWLIWFEVFCSKMLPRLAYFSGRPISVDSPCSTPECDFSAFWPAGLLARTGDFWTIYTPHRFLAYQKQVLLHGPGVIANFFYPPFMLLPSSAISFLPFELAFLIWSILLTGLSVILLRFGGLRWRVVGIGLLCPAALWNFELGQLGLITSALLIAGLMRQAQKPVIAGSLLGLLSFKPQAAILAPFALLGARNVNAVVGFIAAVGGLALLTLIFFGPDSWLAYCRIGGKEGFKILQAPFNSQLSSGEGVSVFVMLRSFGASVAFAYPVQIFCSLVVAAVSIWVWSRPGVPAMAGVSLTVLLTLLATPYGYVDDMTAGSIMLAAMAEQRGWKLHLTDVMFWLWPAFCQIVSERTGMLFTPFIVMASAWRVACGAGLLSGLAR